jgi:hypothetical protein
MTNRERFMAALKGEKRDRVPIFPLLMFLAADRASITYRRYATDAKALAEAQLLVQERFDLDAITACSPRPNSRIDKNIEADYNGAIMTGNLDRWSSNYCSPRGGDLSNPICGALLLHFGSS